jgi:hypothetical protein
MTIWLKKWDGYEELEFNSNRQKRFTQIFIKHMNHYAKFHKDLVLFFISPFIRSQILNKSRRLGNIPDLQFCFNSGFTVQLKMLSKMNLM